MACCSQETIYKDEKLLKMLRKTDNLGINMNLKSDLLNSDKENKIFKCKFDSKNVIWTDNTKKLLDSINYVDEKNNDEIIELKKKILDKKLEVENLEKDYLAKAVRLLYMVQTHCQIKSENEELFEKYGIKSGNVFVNNNEIKEKEKDKSLDLDINSIKSKNEEKKQLVEA